MGLALGRSLPISIPDGAMLNRPQAASGTSGPPGFGEPNAALSTSGRTTVIFGHIELFRDVVYNIALIV